MRAALDTNILAYAEGVNGERMKSAAIELVRKLPSASTLVPVQALGELFNVLVRKAGWSASMARAAILNWRDAFTVIETSPAAMFAAADLATDHRLGIWDAVILAAGVSSGCRILLSEDMQEGFIWSGLTIVNPFSQSRHPLLDALLKTRGDD